MTRPRTTGHLAAPAIEPAAPAAPPAPSWQSAIGPIGDALLALVISAETQPSAGPAVKAFRSAIRRKGEEAAAAGGTEAMEAVLRFVVEAAPDRAARRETIITKAWANLPNWRTEGAQHA